MRASDPWEGWLEIRLPDGRYAKEQTQQVPAQGGHEPRYRYSVDTTGMRRDYYGRVEDIRLILEDGREVPPLVCWPFNKSFLDSVVRLFEDHWAQNSSRVSIDSHQSIRVMRSVEYAGLFGRLRDMITKNLEEGK